MRTRQVEIGWEIGLKEGLKGEAARIEKYLRSVIKTYCSGISLKYMNITLMEFFSNKDNGSLLPIPCHQMKLSILGLAYVQMDPMEIVKHPRLFP